jgi:hypothetical protein
MARRALALFVTLSLFGGVARGDEEKQKQYTDKNTFELGESLALSWFENLFELEIATSAGWFFVKRWELSAALIYEYTNVKQPDGTRKGTTLIEFEIEPSYHHEIKPNLLFVFGGIGVGYGYDGEHSELVVAPRVGINIQITRSGLLNPSVRVPIHIGNITGPMNDELGALVGFEFDIGYTTFF